MMYSIKMNICERITKFDWINKSLKISASKYGHLDILKWVHSIDSNTTKVGNELTNLAAEYGHVDVLVWACQQGYPLDIIRAKTTSIIRGHQKVLAWLHSIDTTLPPNAYEMALNNWDDWVNWDIAILVWLRTQGYPWNKLRCLQSTIKEYNGLTGYNELSIIQQTVHWIVEEPDIPGDEYVLPQDIEYVAMMVEDNNANHDRIFWTSGYDTDNEYGDND